MNTWHSKMMRAEGSTTPLSLPLPATLNQLRRDICAGLQSGSAGEIDIEAIKRRGRARLAAALPDDGGL